MSSDLKDGKPLKTFGRIGQGPGEYGRYFAFPFFTGRRESSSMEPWRNASNFYSLDGTSHHARSAPTRLCRQASCLSDHGTSGSVRTLTPKARRSGDDRPRSSMKRRLRSGRSSRKENPMPADREKAGITAASTRPLSRSKSSSDVGKIYVGIRRRQFRPLYLSAAKATWFRTINRETTKIKVPEEEKKSIWRKPASERSIPA